MSNGNTQGVAPEETSAGAESGVLGTLSDAALDAMTDEELDAHLEGQRDDDLDVPGEADPADTSAEVEAKAVGADLPAAGDKSKAADTGSDADDKPPLTRDELNKRHAERGAALRQERSKRQELEQEIARLRAGQNTPAAGQEQNAPETPPALAHYDPDFDPMTAVPPDPQVDPAGSFAYYNKLAAYQVKSQIDAQEQDKAAAQARETFKDMSQKITVAEEEFRKVQPDYGDAVAYLAEARHQEIIDLGHPPEVADATVKKEMLQLTMLAVNAEDRSPAEVIYKTAENRGYRRKAGAEDPAADKAADAAAAKLAARKAAEPLTQTLSGPGGVKSDGVASIEELNAIKDGSEFDAEFERMEKALGG